MSSNKMEGRLPASLSKLQHLRMVELATMPGLGGPLSKELCSVTTLRRLCICRCTLDSPIPDEIGNLVALEELQLFGNRLSGYIPESLGNLHQLKLLSLGEYTGGNNFEDAPIPDCIRHLVSLEALFLSSCNLVGRLPEWLGELKELRQLDLQNNSLQGGMCDGALVGLDQLLYLNVKDNPMLGYREALPVKLLSRLAKLNRLSFVNTGLTHTEAQLDELQERLPRCKIWS